MRYADPAATSLDGIVFTADSGIPKVSTMASANTGQTITIEGEDFDDTTRVWFTTFYSPSPWYAYQLSEREAVPTSVAADGTSLEVVVPDDAVTGAVRLADEPGGLILQIVPTLNDVVGYNTYNDGSYLYLTGSGFTEGGQTLILGSVIGAGGAVEVQDLWNSAGPSVGGGSPYNAKATFYLPVDPPSGPTKVKTLGGTSEPFAITFTGIAADTRAAKGMPTDEALPSANAAETITLEGSGFDSTTEVISPVQASNSNLPSNVIVAPSAVAPDGTNLEAAVPDNAVTGDVRIVGAEGSFFLQIVPTILQVLTPASYSTGNALTIEGGGFIENDVVITLGETRLPDTGASIGPNVVNANITYAGMNRADNDGISLSIPPNATDGPYVVRTAGGSAKYGVIVDLGVVIQEERPGRTVAPGEQELFKAETSVAGWLDFEVILTEDTAELLVLNEDGTPADLIDTGSKTHLRVATDQGQVFYLQVYGVGVPASYDVVVVNCDRFDDPEGDGEGGRLAGPYGFDPDGRNDTIDKSTDFTPASYVFEVLSITPGDVDWFTWTAQATGQMSAGTLFTAEDGELGLRVYADSDGDGILSEAEQTMPVALNDGYAVAPGGTLIATDVDGAVGDSSDDGVLVNDSDADGDVLTAVLVTAPAHHSGTFVLDSNGTFTYVHDGSEGSTDSFTYRAHGGLDDSNLATVVITIGDVGDSPPPVHDTYTGSADLGQPFWAEVFGIDGDQDGATDKDVYAITFSNRDQIVAGLHPDQGAPNNDTQANAVDLGLGVSWNSKSPSIVGEGFLTIHEPDDQDWFRLTAGVGGSLQVLVDLEHPEVGQINVYVVDATSGDPLTRVDFEDQGKRLRLVYAPVRKGQELLVQFTGQPNAYTFSIQNLDQFEFNPSMEEPALLGRVVHQLHEELSLPGLPDEGDRDKDWFKLTTVAPDGRLDVTVIPDGEISGDVTVSIWKDINDNQIAERELGEVLVEDTSIGGSAVTVTTPADELEAFYIQVFDPNSSPFTGIAYAIDTANIDQFEI